MAKTVSEAFYEFMRRYEPSPWQKDKISTHHNYIRDVLLNKIDIFDDFLTGSYIKQTQIKPPTDIDLFIILDLGYAKSYYPNNANNLLNDFKKLIQQTYSKSSLKPDGQAVVIEFADGIKMDIVPAFQRKGGGYFIPNTNTSTFIPTDPKQYNNLLSDYNKAMEGKLKPLIKMIKCWKYAKELKSLHIEVLALNCFCNLPRKEYYPFTNYQEGLEKFFRTVKDSLNNPSYEPIVGDRIDVYLENPVRGFLSHLASECHKSILNAISFEQSNYHGVAIETWKNIFPDYFPAYY